MSEEQESQETSGSLISRIRRSILSGPLWPRDDRERRWVVLNLLTLHFRPVHVVEKTLRHRHTWGLGGTGLVLILLLMATGCLMMFVYQPSPESAYASVANLESDVLFGPLVRGIHYWSANLLVVVVLLHMLRVFFTGGFTGPRQFNWVIGLALFAGVLASNFTGYLLPWDQLSYWAITISTGMLTCVPVIGESLVELVRGGPEISSTTLIGFFTLHTTVIPVTLIVLMAFHFWRVRKAGGVVVPRREDEVPKEKPAKVLFMPNLFVRELAQGCVAVAVVVVLAAILGAPLGDAANPGMSPNPAKSPWYFAGFQELLLHLPPVLAVAVLPALLVLFLVTIPYLQEKRDHAGIAFRSSAGRRSVILAALAGVFVTPPIIVLNELVSGLLAVVVLVALVTGCYAMFQARLGLQRGELMQATFVLVLVGLSVLTTVCVWFRGHGMALTWPWGLR